MTFDITTNKTNRYCYVNAVLNGERIGKVCVDLDSDDANRYVKAFGGKFAKIILVQTSPQWRGKGIATAMIKKTVEELGDYNLYLNVVPLGDKGREQLIKYYSKFGFVKYEADICTTTMIRLAE